MISKIAEPLVHTEYQRSLLMQEENHWSTCFIRYVNRSGGTQQFRKNGPSQYWFSYEKSDLKKCENYRTFSLVNHSSKILLSVFLQRLRSEIEPHLSEEQAGSRKDCNTIQQILCLRSSTEKHREVNWDLAGQAHPAIACRYNRVDVQCIHGWRRLHWCIQACHRPAEVEVDTRSSWAEFIIINRPISNPSFI